MKNFGYHISADRQIDYDRSDRRVAGYVEQHEPSFRLCFACGTCAATCSAALFTGFSLRAMIGSVRRGEVTNLRKESEKCMLCGKCQLACPRNVNTRNIILCIQKAVEIYQL